MIAQDSFRVDVLCDELEEAVAFVATRCPNSIDVRLSDPLADRIGARGLAGPLIKGDVRVGDELTIERAGPRGVSGPAAHVSNNGALDDTVDAFFTMLDQIRALPGRTS